MTFQARLVEARDLNPFGVQEGEESYSILIGLTSPLMREEAVGKQVITNDPRGISACRCHLGIAQ